MKIWNSISIVSNNKIYIAYNATKRSSIGRDKNVVEY